MDVRAALKEAMVRLRTGQVPSHSLAAELLLMHVTGRDRAWLYAHPETPLDAASLGRYFVLVEQRIAGTPTQYLTSKQEFWGLELHVEPGVLIPRPETEHIVEVALDRLGQFKRPRIVDVGTGSGCLAVALAHELPEAEVFATDISAKALEIARGNAARHSARIRYVRCSLLVPFVRGSLFEPVSEEGSSENSSLVTCHWSLFDLIVSNPPYIPCDEIRNLPRDVTGHEPDEALFGGADGSQFYGPLVAQAARVLRPGGHLVMELGYNTLERVRPLFDAWPAWKHIRVTQDLAGIARVIAAERM